jgi:acetyl esterase/lipase
MVIIDVDYRLAPEFPFPTQIWDAWAGLKWVFANASTLGVDTSRISIGGLSAGGHLSAVLAHLARDEPKMPPLKLQMLVVPAVDSRWVPLEGSCDPNVPYKTYLICEHAPCLPLARMRWFSKLWIGTDPEERKKKAESWLASPILAKSHAGLAPCSIHCAEWDVLRDEALAYNELLNKSGTPSRIKVYQGVCHPFGHWDGALDKAKDYVRSTCADLKKAHAV